MINSNRTKKTHNTWLAIVAYSLGALFLCYEMALQVSPSIMTHDLMRDLHITAAGLGLMSGVYFYTYTAMQIPAGLLYDRYKTRVLTCLGIFICVAGALLFATTPLPVIAGLGRLLMGMGSAFAFIAVLVIAARWFEAKYFALLVGIAQCLAALGAYGGTEPLALAVSHWGWRATLQNLSYFGLLLALLCWFLIRERKSPVAVQAEQDSIAVTEGLRRIGKNPQTWWCALYAFCAWAPITAFPALWGVPFLMKLYGITTLQAGQIIGMIWVGLGIISPFLGWVSDRIGRRRILMTLCALIGLLSSGIILYVPGLPHSLVIFLMLCFGVATSGQVISFALVKDINQANVMATAIGINNMAVVAPGAILQPLVGFLLQSHWQGTVAHGSPVYSISNYQVALSVIPICFVVGLITSCFFIRETYCKSVAV